MKEENKETKLRVFPKNKENLIKIHQFIGRIITNRNHFHLVDGVEKIPEKIPAPVGPGYWDVNRISHKQEFCGKIFFPFSRNYDFFEWSANEWVTFFVCESVGDALKWYCNIKNLGWEETTQEY